jgi:serine/threonine-protein kinase
MNAERWARVKALFHAALDRDPVERDVFLLDMCRDDDDGGALRAEVERLLAAHAEAGAFIEPPPADSTTESRRTIGKYQVDRLLGAGGMGEVYLARDPELNRDVALKLATGNDRDAHARLRREAQHASQLNHPHICTIYEVGSHDGHPFIAMEYVEGRLLSDVIPPGGLPLPQLVRCGAQIADALSHAHANGVTHRDLKSANIAVTPDGRAKVLDFGVARRLAAHRVKDLSESTASITAEGMLVGTLACMPPEVLRGEPSDERSDLWALGVLLYEMASGSRPFAGATGFELTGAILHGSPPPLPGDVPASLRTIVQRCLEKDPRQRYQSANDVRVALDKAAHDVNRGVAQPSGGTRMATIAAAIGAVVLLAAAGMWWRELARAEADLAGAAVAVGVSGHPAVAVLSFDVAGTSDADSEWLSSGVPSMLLTGLAQTRGLDLVSTRRLTDAARQMGTLDLAALDRTQAAEVARRAGAGALVAGTVFRSGSQIRIDAQMEDLTSGRVLVAESVRGSDLFSLVDQLAARIRDGVGLRNASGIRGVAAVSSPSLDAYRLFALGTDAYQNVRVNEATRLFAEAIRVDPEFAAAYLYLGLLDYFAGRFTDRQQHFAKALEHIDRLSERQRLLLRAEIARDAGNGAEADTLLDQLFAEFPDWHDGYAAALELYAPVTGLVHNPEKRLAILRRSVDAQPASALPRNAYGYALLEDSRFKQAVGEFEAYARQSPHEPNPYDSLGEAHLALGMPQRALEYFSRSLAIEPDFYQSHTGRVIALSMLGRFDEAVAETTPDFGLKAFVLMRAGRIREASRTIAGGIAPSNASASVIGQASAYFVSALMALEQGQHDRAIGEIEHVRRILSPLPHERQRMYLVLAELTAGLADVRAGRLARARQRLASQQRLYQAVKPFEKGWHAALEGEIALAEKRLSDAASAFSTGEPATRVWIALYLDYPWAVMTDIPARDGLARVAKAGGDIAGAIATYRRLLVAGPEQKWPALFNPRYVLEIARLVEQSGDRKGALVEYQRFLELWKSADEDLPELAEARRAVARLAR